MQPHVTSLRYEFSTVHSNMLLFVLLAVSCQQLTRSLHSKHHRKHTPPPLSDIDRREHIQMMMMMMMMVAMLLMLAKRSPNKLYNKTYPHLPSLTQNSQVAITFETLPVSGNVLLCTCNSGIHLSAQGESK